MSGTIISGATASISRTVIPGDIVAFRESVRLNVQRRICAMLEEITFAAGWEFDLSPFIDSQGKRITRVYRGRTVFGQGSDPVPVVSLLDGPVPDAIPLAAGPNKKLRDDDWQLYIQGWTPTPEDHPTDPCYQLMAAVEMKLSEMISRKDNGRPAYPAHYMLGGHIAGAQIGPGVVRPPQDQVSILAFFYLPVTLEFPVDVTKPFV
jgi:hypothetical protein